MKKLYDLNPSQGSAVAYWHDAGEVYLVDVEYGGILSPRSENIPYEWVDRVIEPIWTLIQD